MPKLYPGGLFIPQSVNRQTRDALPKFGPAKIPDLSALDWIAVGDVTDTDLAPFRAPQPGQSAPQNPPADGRLTCCGHKIDREEFDVVVLAKRLQATAILDDHDGMTCANGLNVTVQTTRDILGALVQNGHVQGAGVDTLVKKIEATGYFPTRRFSNAARLERGLPAPTKK